MSFSFAALEKQSIAKKRTEKARPKATIIETIARIIDPDAWADTPKATNKELQRQIATMSSIIVWTSAVPTTPEAEFNLIKGERQGLRYANIDTVDLRSPYDIEDRKKAAIQKAQEIFRMVNIFRKRRSYHFRK